MPEYEDASCHPSRREFDAAAPPALAATVIASLRAAGVDARRARFVFAPGRIEFLGKHTDYAGGRSLLCAAEQGICFGYVPRADAVVRLFHPATGTQCEFAFDAGLVPASGHWTNYPMTVARRVARNFPGRLSGADVAIHGDLPPAAGLSSSSALIVGTFLALSGANRLAERPEYRAAVRSPEDLAGYLGCVENGQTFTSADGSETLEGDLGVGTLGGSQDHTAILCCRRGWLSQYGFRPVRHEADVPFPPGRRLVVAVSGVAAEKTGAAQALYNRNPLMVRAILRLWNDATGRADPSLAAAVRSDPEAAGRLGRLIRGASPGEFPPAALLGRLNQFVEESERIIPAAADALRAGDWPALGRLVDESQRLAESGLGNQVPRTAFLARAAREAGAVAASAFGAGFGGSVWALVDEEAVEAFRRDWLARYRVAFPADAALAGTIVTSACSGASVSGV